MFAVLAAVAAAMSFASIKLSAVGDCVLDLQTVAPPEHVNAHPAVDLLFPLRSFADAALKNAIGFPCAMGSGH